MNGFESDTGRGPSLVRKLGPSTGFDSRPLSPVTRPDGKKRLILDDIIGLTNQRRMGSDTSSVYSDSDASSVNSDAIKSLSSDEPRRPYAQNGRVSDDTSSLASESTYQSSGSGSGSGTGTQIDDDDDDALSEYSQVTGSGDTPISLSYEEKQRLKRQYLDKLSDLSAKGYIASREYNMASNYEDVKAEYETLRRRRDVHIWNKNMREYMVTGATFAEFINRTYVPLDIHLDGWSEQVYNRIDECDEIFEQLYDKYGSSIEMNPELQLATWVVKSAVMHHLTAKYFKSSAMPGLDDILRQNPDIMRNISRAAAAAPQQPQQPQHAGAAGGNDIDRILGDLRAGQVPTTAAPQQQRPGPAQMGTFMR
jgi:hypothetical protein